MGELKKFLTALSLLIGTIGPCRAGTPPVSISYSPSWDSVCALTRFERISEPWAEELTSRVADVKALWDQHGKAWITTAEKITGKPFPDGAIDVRLTLCWLPSNAWFGVTVNMRYALKSFASNPVPLRNKVDTIFHELLHVYLAHHQIADSPLLKNHAAEHSRVKNHLHLLALQKAVLLTLGDAEGLAEVIKIDSQLPGGYYKRAWEIINSSDSEYLKYVDEIRKQ